MWITSLLLDGGKGWRVLRSDGSGSTGHVLLVSGGCPLTYYHASGDESSINNLNSMYKSLTVSSGTSSGFRSSGFAGASFDMVKTFSLSYGFDPSKRRSCFEFE